MNFPSLPKIDLFSFSAGVVSTTLVVVSMFKAKCKLVARKNECKCVDCKCKVQ